MVHFMDQSKEFTIEEVMTTVVPTVSATSITFDIKTLLNAKLQEKAKRDLPVINFTKEAYLKMMSIVNGIDKEIAWHGVVKTLEDGSYEIEDILVYPQKVAATTVDSDDEEYGKWFAELDDETFSKIRMQGHSHVNMAVFPSSTDETYYKGLTEHMSDFYLIIISNKREEHLLRFYDPSENVYIENAPFTVDGEVVDYSEWAKTLIDEMIKNKVTTYPTYTGATQRMQTSKETKGATKTTEKKNQNETVKELDVLEKIVINHKTKKVSTIKGDVHPGDDCMVIAITTSAYDPSSHYETFEMIGHKTTLKDNWNKYLMVRDIGYLPEIITELFPIRSAAFIYEITKEIEQQSYEQGYDTISINVSKETIYIDMINPQEIAAIKVAASYGEVALVNIFDSAARKNQNNPVLNITDEELNN